VKDFREFILRGNLVSLAVAFVIGLAFAEVVQSLVRDLVTPLLAAIGGNSDFENLTFTIHGSRFLYGDFLNYLISFLVIAAVLFFLVVKPMNALMARRKTEPPVDESVQQCPHCLSDIPAAASVCAFCTRDVALAG
jgi:large conductance mechanosensitive channel